MAKIRVDPVDGEALIYCPWNKHKGERWTDVVKEDPAYIEWLIGGEGPDMSSRLYDHLVELLEKA